MFSCSTFCHKYFTLLFFPGGLWSVEMNVTSCLTLGNSSGWAGDLHSWGTKRKRRVGVLNRVAEPADGAWECKTLFAMVCLCVCTTTLHFQIVWAWKWTLKVIFSHLFCPPVKGRTWTWQTQSRALLPFGQFWDPFTGAKQRAPISPGCGFVIQLIAMAVGLGWGFYI